MHIEILVEDISGERLLEQVLPNLIDHPERTTFKLHSYKGIGHLPSDLISAKDIRSQQLLRDMPRMIRAYGRTFAGYGPNYPAALLIVSDLDDGCLRELRNNLAALLQSCRPAPNTIFCFAIEEMEAWLLGDIEAIKAAYPRARPNVLTTYEQDSICGTWELLANAIYKGGVKTLKTRPYFEIGAQKSEWAIEIASRMNIASNRSPSFQYFCQKMRYLVESC